MLPYPRLCISVGLQGLHLYIVVLVVVIGVVLSIDDIGLQTLASEFPVGSIFTIRFEYSFQVAVL